MEGKGFFTKEIENALLNKEIDLAVHSHKDLETTNPEGLVIAAVSERENPADLLLVRKDCIDQSQKFDLKKDAVVGTSSARRKAQILHFRPDVSIEDIRGNINTRVQKLRDGKFDAILIALAGIKRLEFDLSDLHVVEMDPTEFVPAPAQGVLGLQVREDDSEIIEVLRKVDNEEVSQRVKVERGVLKIFNGGCQLPLGVYCVRKNGKFVADAAMAEEWNTKVAKLHLESETTEGMAQQIVDGLKKQL
jgi:hydroxymethylbilane synthase